MHGTRVRVDRKKEGVMVVVGVYCFNKSQRRQRGTLGPGTTVRVGVK